MQLHLEFLKSSQPQPGMGLGVSLSMTQWVADKRSQKRHGGLETELDYYKNSIATTIF